ncbi:MAG: M48 family metalloprotease [Deltaproteobacteria bacterium]|nr:M48 family metalloprotease [Deltaproteobacteria bacterium]
MNRRGPSLRARQPRAIEPKRAARLGALRAAEGWLKTAVLLATLAGMSALVGLLLFGWVGLLIAVGTVLVIAAVGLRVPASWVMRVNGAVPVAPWQAPSLHRTVAGLASRAGVAAPDLYLIPSAVPNALTTGGGAQRAALAVTEGALRALEPDELEGVLAHEVAHIKNRDISIQQVAGTISNGVSSLLEVSIWIALLGALFGGTGFGRMMLLMLLAVSVPIAVRLLNAALSRTREYAADAEAAALTGRPLSLARALQKLAAIERGWLGGWLAPMKAPPLLASHPPTPERVRRLVELGGAEKRTAPSNRRRQPIPIRVIRAPHAYRLRSGPGVRYVLSG